jgi:hypothetical protein
VSPEVQALVSLHELPVSGFGAQPPGSLQTPEWHWSAEPEQSRAPPPLQTPEWQDSLTVHVLPSLQPVVSGSFAVQFFPPSLQEPLQLESEVFRGRQGSPVCWAHEPEALQVSVPSQKTLLLQPVPAGSFAVQFFAPSLHDPVQLESAVLSGRQGSPVCWPHEPAPSQVSVPSQKTLLLQPVPAGSAAVQLSAPSLHDVAQFASVVLTLQGLPECCEQEPVPLQLSVPSQNTPLSQPVPGGSAALQASIASLHEVAQLLSVGSTVHGLPPWIEQVPPLHVSAPLQNAPSVHGNELFTMRHPVDALAPMLDGLQVSVVQPFESLHTASTGVITHPVVASAEPLDGLHVSVVHDLPSLHAASFVAFTHPVDAFAAPLDGLQVSVVQDLPSLQAALTWVMTQPVSAFARRLEGLQVSVVQDLPSLQAASTCVFTHPVVGSAETLAGLQLSVVQDLLSLQLASTFVCEHVPDELQESVVHDLPSLHAAVQQNPPAQSPAVPLAKTQSESNVQAEPGPFL